MTEARALAEQTARASYGRLIATIARVSGDISAAEDALGDALVAALKSWPESGVPESPDAWLITTARRKSLNQARHAQVATAAQPDLFLRAEETADASEFGDKRLELLFVCAHPAIDDRARTPLMLQTVLGLSAERIAAAYAEDPKTLGQRLVRAKRKIKEAAVPFRVPDADELTDRLPDVLHAIYGAFGQGWDDPNTHLASEACFLGDLLVNALPQEPETKGLLALMLFVEARRAARRTAYGAFIPLDRQDPTLWNKSLLLRAEGLLQAAARTKQPGRFQLEAAIQSMHNSRAFGKDIDHQSLLHLHDTLLAIAPSLGAEVSRASVLISLGDMAGAETALSAIDAKAAQTYQPYWVTHAELARAKGLPCEDLAAKAIALTEDPALITYLSHRFTAAHV
ncbi:MAG: DUF6596 domain-containing protein [Pseudomonadota bacterium]